MASISGRASNARVRRWRVEEGRVGDCATRSLGHAVVDLQDDPRGAVLAVLGLVAFADDGKGVENLRGVVSVEAVEVKKGGIQLATEQAPTTCIPAERRAIVTSASPGSTGHGPLCASGEGGGGLSLLEAGSSPGLWSLPLLGRGNAVLGPCTYTSALASLIEKYLHHSLISTFRSA